MSVGQKSKLTIANDYAFGKIGYLPIIPQSQGLIFEVELLAFEADKTAR